MGNHGSFSSSLMSGLHTYPNKKLYDLSRTPSDQYMQEELPLVAGARVARQRAPLRPPPSHEEARDAQEAARERPQAEAGEEGAAGGHGEAGGGHGGSGGRTEEGPGRREEGGEDHEGEESVAAAEEATRQVRVGIWNLINSNKLFYSSHVICEFNSSFIESARVM